MTAKRKPVAHCTLCGSPYGSLLRKPTVPITLRRLEKAALGKPWGILSIWLDKFHPGEGTEVQDDLRKLDSACVAHAAYLRRKRK